MPSDWTKMEELVKRCLNVYCRIKVLCADLRFEFLGLNTIKKCPYMLRLDRKLRNSLVKLLWVGGWWVVCSQTLSQVVAHWSLSFYDQDLTPLCRDVSQMEMGQRFSNPVHMDGWDPDLWQRMHSIDSNTLNEDVYMNLRLAQMIRSVGISTKKSND